MSFLSLHCLFTCSAKIAPYVESGFDLALVEMLVNDVPSESTLPNGVEACLEAVLRQILALTSAVIMVDLAVGPRPMQKAGNAERANIQGQVAGLGQDVRFPDRALGHWRLASYYGLRLLSMRAGLHSETRGNLKLGCGAACSPCEHAEGEGFNCENCAQISTCKLTAAEVASNFDQTIEGAPRTNGGAGFFGMKGVDDVHFNCIGHHLSAMLIEHALLEKVATALIANQQGTAFHTDMQPCCIATTNPAMQKQIMRW